MSEKMEPCKPDLLRHSRMDHGELRKLTGDGRCPICDPAVPRSEYAAVCTRLVRDPQLRKAVVKP